MSLNRRRGPALAIAVVCGVVAIYLGFGAADAAKVRRANEHGIDGRFRAALQEAGQVTRAPADAAALLVRARALTQLGDAGPADRAWRATARRMPNDWRVHFEWSVAILNTGGDRRHALDVYARARELNPRLPAAGG